MSIDLSLQNFTQLFWTIIIASNLYVILLLYRVSKLYRVERLSKLQATANLKESIELMHINYVNSIGSASVLIDSTGTGSKVESCHTRVGKYQSNERTEALRQLQSPRRRSRSCSANHRQVRDPHEPKPKHARRMPDISSSSSIATNRSDDNRNNPHPEDELHRLYISDSFGRVVHEIPFRERDYVEALRSVLT